MCGSDSILTCCWKKTLLQLVLHIKFLRTMSITELVDQHWNDIRILSQLCVYFAQLLGSNVRDDEDEDAMESENDDDDRRKFLQKIVSRVIALTTDIEHLNNTHQVFYHISHHEIAEIDLIQKWSTQIITLCDSLAAPFEANHQNETDDTSNWDVIELNEYIEILEYKHLTLRFLSYPLSDSQPENALKCIMESIEICERTNGLIQRFNTEINEFGNRNNANSENSENTQNSENTENADHNALSESDREIRRLIDNGQIEKRTESIYSDCYRFAANICQKLNRFKESLDLINRGIEIVKTEAIRRFREDAHAFDGEGAIIVDSDDEVMDEMVIIDDNDSDDHQSDGTDTKMADVDSEQNEAARPSMDIDHNSEKEDIQKYEEYQMDIELSDDIKRFSEIRKKKWSELDDEEKLFLWIQRKSYHLISLRGATYGNLSEYLLAFHDEYWCTLMKSEDISAWNNRAFAWYQLGRHKECIADCNYALYELNAEEDFSRGLLVGNRGLAEHKLGLYHRAVNDLNFCLKRCPQSRLAREALHAIWKEFTDAIYYGVSRIEIDDKDVIDIPFVIAKIIADYGVGIDFEIIPQCHESTIVYE